jgi:hypothetical protein
VEKKIDVPIRHAFADGKTRLLINSILLLPRLGQAQFAAAQSNLKY